MPLESQVRLRLTSSDGRVDAAELESLAVQLRADLLAAGMARVERELEGPAPAGARSAELVAAGIGFLVTGLSTVASAAQVAEFVQRWREAHPRRRRVTVKVTPAGAGPAARGGRRSALLIANAAYADPALSRLRSPPQDTRALGEVLGAASIGGFEVERLVDADEPTVRRRVAAFLADRDPDDVLLLHFSCHGLKDQRGRLYLAAADTHLRSLAATGLPASFVADQMSESAARRGLLILDCCYSGAFARGAAVRADRAVHIAEEFGGGTGWTVLTASSATEYSFEGGLLTADEARPSVFTQALVDGLQTGDADLNGDGDISADELYEYVHRRIREARTGQEPRKWTFGMAGALVVARSPRPPAAAAPPPQAATAPPAPVAAPAPAAPRRRPILLAALAAAVVLVTLAAWLIVDAVRSGQEPAAFGDALGTITLADSATLSAVDLSPDGRVAVTVAEQPAGSAEPRTLHLWDTADGRSMSTLDVDTQWVFSPDNRWLATAHHTGERKTVTHNGEPMAVITGGDTEVRLHDLAAGTTTATLTGHRGSAGIAFTPDGDMVATAGTGVMQESYDNPVRLWDPKTGRLLDTYKGHTNGVQSMEFSPGGTTLVTGSVDHTARVWSLSTGKAAVTVGGKDDMFVYVVRFSPDGRLLATAGGGDSIRLWNVATGKLTATLDASETFAFSPDGKRLATFGDGRTVRLWDTATGDVATTLSGHTGKVSDVVFSPDGKLVATGGADTSVRLWDTGTGALAATLSGHGGAVTDLRFEPDGRTLISAGLDRTVRRWHTAR